MKKIVSILLSLIMLFSTSINAFAVSLSRLPISSDDKYDYQILEKNVNLKASLTVEEEEILVIPQNKRITLNGGKTVTVKGGIFIENGGSLIINNGKLVINGGTIISKGTVNIKDKGSLTVKNEGVFITAKDGAFKHTGKINDKNGDVICFGRYAGNGNFSTEILYAVCETVNVFSGEKSVDIYKQCEATALFPEMNLSEEQSNPSGNGTVIYVTFLCSNDRIFRVFFNSALDSGLYSSGGIRLKE